jgi:hypothetical protein
MFRAIICSSSGGQIVYIQHLVSSLCIGERCGRTVYRLRVLSQPVHRTATTFTYTEWRYQMLYIYNLTSWWWAYYSSKHVEQCNITWIKKFCALSWYLVNSLNVNMVIDCMQWKQLIRLSGKPIILCIWITVSCCIMVWIKHMIFDKCSSVPQLSRKAMTND